MMSKTRVGLPLGDTASGCTPGPALDAACTATEPPARRLPAPGDRGLPLLLHMTALRVATAARAETAEVGDS